MKKKNIFLITITILLIFIITFTLIFNKIQNNQEKTIEATVLAVGSNYLLVTTEDNVDYLILTEDLDYKVGDYLKLELTRIKMTSNVTEATAKDIIVISKNNSTNEENITAETSSSNNTQDKTVNQSFTEKRYSEEEIINYFNDLDNELTNYDNNESISQKIKSKFVQCIDFIFYDGVIGNVTFKELTNTTKLKILSITLSIDNKIDNKFPGYKDTISSAYQNLKSQIVAKYLDITTTTCSNEPELCITAKEGFKDLKNNFGLTWNLIKDLAETGTDKLKSWYEIWRYN